MGDVRLILDLPLSDCWIEVEVPPVVPGCESYPDTG